MPKLDIPNPKTTRASSARFWLRPTYLAAIIAVFIIALTLYFTLYRIATPKGKSSLAQVGAEAETEFAKKFVRHASPRRVAAINFALTDEADSKPSTLAAFAGEILVVNFWATWCAPCRREMPQLDALQNHFSDQPVRVLAIALDRGNDQKPQKFLDELGVHKLTRAHDGSYKSARQVGLIGLPTTLIIDKNGFEIGRLAGEAGWNSAPVYHLIEQLLAR